MASEWRIWLLIFKSFSGGRPPDPTYAGLSLDRLKFHCYRLLSSPHTGHCRAWDAIQQKLSRMPLKVADSCTTRSYAHTWIHSRYALCTNNITMTQAVNSNTNLLSIDITGTSPRRRKRAGNWAIRRDRVIDVLTGSYAATKKLTFDRNKWRTTIITTTQSG